jgi:uncharacterized protein
VSLSDRAAELIERLHLHPHPEGGHYAEVHRGTRQVDPRDGRPLRAALTSIHFLLRQGEASRWHRVASDEVWCHLEGAALDLHLVDAERREWRSVILGPVSAQAQAQHTVPAQVWQAARGRGDYTLCACIVGPGFEFDDFELMPATHPLRAWLARERPDWRGF